MTSLIGYSDIFNLTREHLSKRFGGDARVSDCGDQIVVTLEPRNSYPNEDVTKFGQVMHFLSYPRTWFHRQQHAVETAFEKTLASLNVPLDVGECQKTVYVFKPPETTPLDEFLPGSEKILQEIKERRKKIRSCYDTICRSLERKGKLSYVPRKKQPEGRENLLNYIEQPTLDFFLRRDPHPRSRVKPRSRNWRKMRFDMIFEINDRITEEPALVLSEVKAFSTVRRKIAKDRANQLRAYDAWLKMNRDDDVTPMCLVLPTILSHVEISMVENVKRLTGREVVPICVTTFDYASTDIKRRRRQSERVERVSGRYDMDPEVVKIHKKEHKHLSNALSLL